MLYIQCLVQMLLTTESVLPKKKMSTTKLFNTKKSLNVKVFCFFYNILHVKSYHILAPVILEDLNLLSK